MRLSIAALLALACSSESTMPRSSVQYSTDPSTGECVANAPGDPATGTACEPGCDSAGTCADVCPAIACDENTPTNDDGTAGANADGTTDPSGGGSTTGCPYGYVIGPDGCPTCECYDPTCDGGGTDPNPGDCNDPSGVCCDSTDPSGTCCTNADGTACCNTPDGSCCDPATGENCDPGGGGGCDPSTGAGCDNDGTPGGTDGSDPGSGG